MKTKKFLLVFISLFVFFGISIAQTSAYYPDIYRIKHKHIRIEHKIERDYMRVLTYQINRTKYLQNNVDKIVDSKLDDALTRVENRLNIVKKYSERLDDYISELDELKEKIEDRIDD